MRGCDQCQKPMVYAFLQVDEDDGHGTWHGDFCSWSCLLDFTVRQRDERIVWEARVRADRELGVSR